MTTNVSFKRRIRDRMARTGERYTTARAHLLAEHAATEPDGLLPGWQRTGGVQPDLAAVANALHHVGVTGVLGEPIDEIDVLGLSGGVGFLYGLFEWEGYGPTLTLTTRNDSMPDATVEQALSRAGVAFEVEETTSANKAAATLVARLEEARPVLLTVDESGLADSLSNPETGGYPRVVGAIGRRDDGTFLLDDQAPDPIPISAEQLAEARQRLPKSRNRLIVIGDPGPDHDIGAAVVSALRRTVDGYDEPPAKPFASNVGTRGLRKWAAALTGGDKRSWAKVFADPGHRAAAFDRVFTCINADLTAPGAGRGLWATFVERAAGALDLRGLERIADAARDSERRWLELGELARAADPDADPTETFATMAAMVTAIADREEQLLGDLRRALTARE